MKHLCRALILTLGCAAVVAAEPVADPAVELEKAVQIEQTTDNAAEAEAIYRRIISDHERRAAAAAEARYRLGALLMQQGKEEEGRKELILLRYGPQQGLNEWQMKAGELLGNGQAGFGMGFGAPPGFAPANPFAQGHQDPFGMGMDPFLMENPFGSGMGMMMEGEAMAGPGMGFGGRQAAPMRSLEQIREADELLTQLEVESSRNEQQIRANHPLVKAGRRLAGDLDANDPLIATELRREEHLRVLIAHVRANPGVPSAWISLGERLLERNNLNHAKSAYKQALQLKPPSNVEARILNMLGQIAMQQEQDDEALLHYTHAIHADDSLMGPFMGIARLAEKRGDTISAIRNLHRVLQFEPNNREARTLLQQIDPDAESAPAPRTESELAAARELAMNEGRFEDALTLEEEILKRRHEANDIRVDTYSFSELVGEWVQKSKPTEERLEEAIEAVQSRQHLLARDDPRQWRFYLVLSRLAEAKGDIDTSVRWVQDAMNHYPSRNYVDPAQHSYFQHLFNTAGGHWWTLRGRDYAIQEAINFLEHDRRLQHLHVDWWLDRIAEKGGDADYQRRFLERVIQAYDKRAERFKDQAAIATAEKQILRRRIEQLRQ